MNLSIALCDDDIAFMHSMLKYIDIFSFSHLNLSISTHEFNNGYDLINSIKSGINYDVVFLDVEMPKINGLELAESIRAECHLEDVIIIFVSNYSRYMQDSFSSHPFYYFQKPLIEDSFINVLNEISEILYKKHKTYTVISSDMTEYLLNLDKIIYIESTDSKSRILTFHLLNEEVSTKGTLAEWCDILKDYYFFICHKGILVNIEYIHYIKEHKIYLSNGDSIPLSRRHEQGIKNHMVNQILTTIN